MIRTGRPFLLYKHAIVIVLSFIFGILISVFRPDGEISLLLLSMVKYSGFLKLSFYYSVPFLLIITFCFLNGFSLLCGFLRYVSAILLGFGIGNIGGNLIQNGGGILAYGLCIFIPTSFIYVFVTLISLNECEKMWNKIYLSVFSSEYISSVDKLFKDYTVKFFLIFLCSALSSVIISLINKVFFGLFKIVL